MTRIALLGSAAAIALTLAGCDQLRQATGMGGGDNAGATANGAAATPASTGNVSLSAPVGADPGGKPASGAADNPLLALQMSQAAAQLQSILPKTVDSITTLTGVRADGTQFVYEMTISRALPAGAIENTRQLAQAHNQANLCRDPNTSRLIDMGGSMRHIYTLPGGDRFETLVTSCAG